MNEMTLVRTSLLLRRELGQVFPELKGTPIRVTVEDEAHTASAASAGPGKILITLPTTFCGHPVEGELALGLAAHELGHALFTDFEETESVLEGLEQNPSYSIHLGHIKAVANYLEDARIESLLPEPFSGFLIPVREAARRPLPANPNLYDYLSLIRFSDPCLPYTFPDHENEVLLQLVAWFNEAVHAAGAHEIFSLAISVVFWASERGLLPPEPPPVAAPRISGIGKPLTEQKPFHRGEGMIRIVDRPDPEIVREGRRLGALMQKGWASPPKAHEWVGVGKYRPRLDREGAMMPPFTLPLRRKPSLPPRALVLLDVSDSMWARRLKPARIATVAVAELLRRAGGKARFVVFARGWTFVPDEVNAITWRGVGTSLDFLPDLARQHPGWELLIITDAGVDVPRSWGKRERARTTVLLIETRSYIEQARALANRVIEVQDPTKLPLLVALASRKFGAVSRV